MQKNSSKKNQVKAVVQGEIKMRAYLSILFVIVCAFSNLNAQDFDLNEYNKEKEKILNVVINSLQFDSVYTAKKVYFVANELLSEETPLVLKKGKCKVKIEQREVLKEKGKSYVALGDFTMPKVNPIRVRVQISAMPSESLLNLVLEKKVKIG